MSGFVVRRGLQAALSVLAALTMITAANTTMQLATAPHLRGRVMALYLMVFMGGTPIGSPFIGWLGETFGARWTLIGGGGLTLLGVLLSVALFTRSRHRLGEKVLTTEPVRAVAVAS